MKNLCFLLVLLALCFSCKKNASPTASFTVTPGTGDTKTQFLFDAGASSDKETSNDQLLFRWDWENDAQWDTEFATNDTVVHRFLEAGTYNVKLQVKDEEGETGESTVKVTVIEANKAPVAVLEITPASGNTGTVFSFDASKSHDAETIADLLEVRWDWENNGLWDTEYSTTKTATHQYAQAGDWIVKLEVKDGKGEIGTITDTIRVAVNNAPVASFTITPPGGDVSTVFSFDASGCTDQETPAADLEVRWDWESNGTWDTEFSTTKTISHQYSSDGIYAVKLEVKDQGGLIGNITKIIQVTTNSGPTASFTITPATGNISTGFSFDASTSSDKETRAADLQVRWDWENDGTWDTNFSTTKTQNHQYALIGDYTIKLEVKDEGGLTGTTTRTLTVSNTPPVASFTAAQINAVSFQFDASGSTDLETPAAGLTFRWDWQNDGIWDTEYSTVKSIAHEYTQTGDYTVKLEVKDQGGLTGSTTRTVRATVNTAPTALFTISPETGNIRSEFTYDASGSTDIETRAADLEVRWDWKNNGTWSEYTTEKIARHTYNEPGTFTVKLEVKDGGGLTNTATKTIVVSPAVPIVTTADISQFYLKSAVGGGEVISEEGGSVTSRGVCWSTSPNPSLSDGKSSAGSGLGAFNATLTGLAQGTTYYVRAFASNSAGPGYGEQKQFSTNKTGTFTDSRDNHVYSTITIGTQTWMAENLAYFLGIALVNNGSVSEARYYIYGNTSGSYMVWRTLPNFKTYGVLYNRTAADNACPSGWHLPSRVEWQVLEKNNGMNDSDLTGSGWRSSGAVGNKLKEGGTDHWQNSGTSMNASGFTALPGGIVTGDYTYELLGYEGSFWTSSIWPQSILKVYYYYRNFAYNQEGVYSGTRLRGYDALSIRCIKD